MSKTDKPIEEFDHVEDATPAWQRHDWTVQEAVFVQAYLRTGDVSRAWVEAYRPAKGEDADGFFDSRVNLARARLEGNKLLMQPAIRDYVKHMREEIKARLSLTKDAVLEELNKLAMSNMVDFLVIGEDGNPAGYDLSGLSREQYAAIQEMTIDTYTEGRGENAEKVKSVKLKLAPKLGALEALGKHFKLFTDVVEVQDITDAADVMRRRKEEQRKRRLAEREAAGETLTADELEEREERARIEEETDHLGDYPTED
jgi:hypothetical protein